MTIEVLYQDEHLVAVHKPPGMLIHRSDLARDVTDPNQFLMICLRNQLGQYVYPVHRLDRPTSGVMVFALNQDIQRELSWQFEHGTTEKEYQAVVRGWTDDSGLIDHAIAESKEHNKQDALTHFDTLQRYELPVATKRYATARYSWLKVTPKTGRYHQIRKHMKHISHQLVGDTTHGDGVQNDIFRSFLDIHRMLLFSTSLTIKHPISHETLVFTCMPDTEIQAKLEPYKCK